MALKRQNHTVLLLDLYREIYGPAVTMANLNELAADLSRIAGRNQDGRPGVRHRGPQALEQNLPGVDAGVVPELQLVPIGLAHVFADVVYVR